MAATFMPWAVPKAWPTIRRLQVSLSFRSRSLNGTGRVPQTLGPLRPWSIQAQRRSEKSYIQGVTAPSLEQKTPSDHFAIRG